MTKKILGLFKMVPAGNGKHWLMQKDESGVWATCTPEQKRLFLAQEAIENLDAIQGGDDAICDYLFERGIM